MIVEAPKMLEAWVASEQGRLDAHGISGDLRVPPSTSDTSKASVSLDGGPIIGTLTVWSQGTVEFIAVDATTGDDLRSTDAEYPDAATLQAALSSFLDEFIEFCSMKAEH